MGKDQPSTQALSLILPALSPGEDIIHDVIGQNVVHCFNQPRTPGDKALKTHSANCVTALVSCLLSLIFFTHFDNSVFQKVKKLKVMGLKYVFGYEKTAPSKLKQTLYPYMNVMNAHANAKWVTQQKNLKILWTYLHLRTFHGDIIFPLHPCHSLSTALPVKVQTIQIGIVATLVPPGAFPR